MAVPVVNIQIEQGTEFSATYTVTAATGSPLDLTNHSISAKVGKYEGSQGLGFGVTYGSSPTEGKITISLDNATSGIITAGRYHYDVVVTNDITSKKSKVITGQAHVNGTIS